MPKHSNLDTCQILGDSFLHQAEIDDFNAEKNGFDGTIKQFFSTHKRRARRRLGIATDKVFSTPEWLKEIQVAKSSKRREDGLLDGDLLFNIPGHNTYNAAFSEEALPSISTSTQCLFKYWKKEVTFSLEKDGFSVKTEMLGPPLIPASEMSYEEKITLWWQGDDITRFKEKSRRVPVAIGTGSNVYTLSARCLSYRVAVSSPYRNTFSPSIMLNILGASC